MNRHDPVTPTKQVRAQLHALPAAAVVPVGGARRSPAELFVKSLLVQPGLSNDDVRAELCRLALDDGDAGYLDRLRRELAVPKGIKPRDRRHRASRELLARHGLVELVDRDAVTEIAFELLAHGRAREAIETLALTGAPARAIAGVLTRKVNVTGASPESVQRFLDCFWDVRQFSMLDLRLLLDRRARIATEQAREEGPAAVAAVTRAHRRDPRRAVLGQPRSPTTFGLGMLRLGLPIQANDLEATLGGIRSTALLRAAEATNEDGLRAAQRGSAFMDIVETATRLLGAVVDPNKTLHAQLSAIAITSSESRPKFIGDLSGGHHSTDLLGVDERGAGGESLEP